MGSTCLPQLTYLPTYLLTYLLTYPDRWDQHVFLNQLEPMDEMMIIDTGESETMKIRKELSANMQKLWRGKSVLSRSDINSANGAAPPHPQDKGNSCGDPKELM